MKATHLIGLKRYSWSIKSNPQIQLPTGQRISTTRRYKGDKVWSENGCEGLYFFGLK